MNRFTTACIRSLLMVMLLNPGEGIAQPESPGVDQFISDQRWTEALHLLEHQLEKKPGDINRRFLKARVLAWSGDYEASRKEYKKLLGLNPRNVDFITGLARVELWSGKADGAAALFEQAIHIKKRNSEAWQGLLEATQRKNPPGNSSEIILRAREVYPSFEMEASRPSQERLNEARALIAASQYREAAQQLRSYLDEIPNDLDARHLLASTLAWGKEFNASRTQYRTLLLMQPENTDYLEGAANVELWSGHPNQAIPLLERGIKKAPLNLSLRRNYIRALEDNLEFDRAASERSNAQKAFPNESWMVTETQRSPEPSLQHLPGTMVLFGGSYEALNHGYASWSSTDLAMVHRPNDTQTFTGGLSEVNRYGLTDAELKLAFSQRLDTRWIAGIETNDSPTNHFLPIWSVRGTLQYLFDDGWSMEVGYRRSAYRVDTTNIGTINIEKYLGEFRLGYTLFISHIDGTSNVVTSSLGSASYYYADRSYFGVMIGQGTQPIVNGPVTSPNNIVYSNTQTYIVRGEHWLDQNWALAYDAGVNIQGNYYTRYGFNLGVRYAF